MDGKRYKSKGIIAIVLGVLCAIVLGACSALGVDGAGRRAEKAASDALNSSDSGSVELEEEEKGYATAGQLGYPLAALNASSVIVDKSGNGSSSVTQTLTLEAAYVYLFECWGAQGGGAYGGQGGYAKGYYQPSSNVTAYVYVGGYTGNQSAGFNGGGQAASGTAYGGGGASDIRINGTSYSNRIIVAGGGGGNGQNHGTNNAPDGGGAGGGETGGSGRNDGGSRTSSGGTQSSGGIGGLWSGYNSGATGSLGVGGYGGSGTGGGGGGGGYYGGGGGGWGGGGGGSGYVGGVKWQTGTANGSAISFSSTSMMQQGGNSGQGRVRITRFNTITIKSVPTFSVARGTATTLVNTSVATEYNNSSWGLAFAGADYNSVGIYYLNGSTYTNAAGRYVDNVSVTRSAYTDHSQTLKFTPRVYMNNQTLYVRMYSNQYRFYIYLPIRVTTPQSGWVRKDQTLTRTVQNNTYTLKVGLSTKTGTLSSEDLKSDPETWGIYNPSANGRQTMFITMPIGINSTLTVNAVDFYTDADAADGVYIAAANKNGNDADFDTTLNTVSDGLSFPTYGSITIKPKSTDNTGYMRLTLTLRNYEKKANYSGVSLPSGATLESSGHVKWAETQVDVVFRLDNTRPVPMSARGGKDASVTVKSGETAKIYVNQFADDPDRNVNTIARDKDNVIVPSRHFLPVKKDAETIVTLTNSPYTDTFTALNSTTKKDNANANRDERDKSLTFFDGMGTLETKFSSTWITTNAADGLAYVAYAIRTDASNGLDYIEFTGLRATDSKWEAGEALGDFYILVRIVDAGESDDPGIYLPIAIRVTDGDSTKVSAIPAMTFKVGETDRESEIFTPWGMTYQSGTTQATVGMGRYQGTDFTDPDNLGWNNIGTGYPHRYLATDRDNFVYSGSDAANIMNKPQNDPLFIDHKDPHNQNLLNNTAATNSDFSKFFKVEFVKLYMLKSIFADLTNYDLLVTNGYINEVNNNIIWINGLKVTALKSTQNMFIEFDVNIVSSRVRKQYGATGNAFDHSTTASLRCKVEGATPRVLVDTTTGSGSDAVTVKNLGETIRKDGNASITGTGGNYTLTVEVKNGQTLRITPYDFVTDGDLPSEINKTNSNPADSGYNAMQTATNTAYKVKFADSAAGALMTSGSIYTEGMRMDRLRFGSLGYVQNDRYASITCDPDAGTDSNASRNIDRIIVTGKEKPTSQSVFASTSVNVYDSQGNSITVTLNVRVINSAPQLSAAAIERDYFRLSASGTANATNDETLPSRSDLDGNNNTDQFYDDPTAAKNDDHNIQNVSAGKVYYNVREYTVRELVFDVDSTDRERGLISISESSFAPNVIYNYTRIQNATTGLYEYVPLADKYVSAEITNGSGHRSNERVLRVTGLSSTQGLTGGLFLRFLATDETTTTTLFLQFEVMNSDPVVNTDKLVEGERDGEKVYSWEFDGENRRTNNKTKFIVSDAALGEQLVKASNNGLSNSALYNVIASDADQNQKVVPVATALNFTDKVPTVINPDLDGNSQGVLRPGDSPTDSAAIWLTYGGNGSAGSGYTVRGNVTLTYYEKTGSDNSVTFTPHTFQSTDKWINTLDYEWAIAVNDKALIDAGDKVQLHMTLTSSNRNVLTKREIITDGKVSGYETTDISGGTEGGFGASTGVRVRANGKKVTYNDGVEDHDVVNNVSSFVKVNLDIVSTPTKLINNFEANTAAGNVDGDETIYYAEAPDTTADGVIVQKSTFTYHPIEVPTTGYTAVPLSYFARTYENRKYPQEMLTTVNYATASAVEREGNFSQAYSAIRIFDGYGNSWTGSDLNNNPYVTVAWAYPEEIINTNKGAQKYLILNPFARPVYDSTVQANNIVQSMANAAEAQLYTEDTRGIKLTKKYQRSNNDVYISVDLCQWDIPTGEGYREDITKDKQTWRVADDRRDLITVPKGSAAGAYTAKATNAPVTTVTVKLNIANSAMELKAKTTETIRTNVGASNSAIFLSNVGTDGNPEALPTIYASTNRNVVYNVTDPDNVNITGRDFGGDASQKDLYRDKALFLANSVTGDFNDEQKEHLADTAKNGVYGDAIKKYLGNKNTVDTGFVPNPNYENYFTLGTSTGDTGLLSIRPVRKTALNIDTLKTYKDDIQTLATSKGLGDLDPIPSSSSTDYISILDKYAQVFDLRYDKDGFYYPFKLVAYDDYNGSGFLKSEPTAVEVKIYIDNTAPSANSMVTTSTDTISFSLSVTDDPTRRFEIATLLNDSDMLRNEIGTNYYFGQNELVKKYTDYKNAAKDADGKPTDNSIDDFRLLDLLTTDYIGTISVSNGSGAVDPESTEEDWKNSTNAVSYWIEKNGNSGDGDAFTRINFHANKRVSETIVFKMDYFDNNNNVVAGGDGKTKTLIFNVTVTNNRPTEAETDTSPKEITMATGDSFTLLATSPKAFENNDNSGVANSNSFGYWENRKNDIINRETNTTFLKGITDIYNDSFMNENQQPRHSAGSGNLGSIVVFEDDTPWALRFDSSHVDLSSPILAYERNVPENYFLTREDGASLAPLAYTFKATRPGTTTLKVRAFDESFGSYRDHEITVTVNSTAPKAKTETTGNHPLGEKIKFKDKLNDAYRYTYAMSVGDTRRFTLTDFAFDVDAGDDDRMRLAPVQGTTYFFYNQGNNDTGMETFTAENIKQLISVSDRRENAFTVTAQDFSTDKEAYGSTTVVKFLIADGSGAEGTVEIHLWITVNPSDITANGAKEYTVKSVLEYYTDSDAAPTRINLVSRENGDNAANAVFIDNDLAANATKYTVEIYSMQRKTDKGYAAVSASALAEMTQEDRSAYLAYSSVSGATYDKEKAMPNVDYLWDYLDPKGIKFNEKTGVLELVPKKSTPVVNGELTKYELYVVISKPYYDSSVNDAKKECSSTFKFSVKNSAPTATPEVADNMNDDRTRFLTFNAYRGDEKEFVVFDSDAEDRKTLFEDYDVDDTLTVRSVEVKRVGGQAQIYKLYSEKEEGSENYVQKRFPINEQALEDGGTGRGAAVSIDRRGGKVKFTVNRRITYDQYDDLPTYIVYTVTVADSAGNTATTDVTVVVNNSLPGFKVPDPEKEDEKLPDNVTMEFDGLEYSMTVKLERDAKETVLNLNSFYTDKDFDTRSLSSDRAVFSGSDDPKFKYYDEVGTGAATTWGNSSFDNLFSVNATRDNAALVFRALSYERGQSVDTKLIVSDGTGAEPVVLNIKLVIDNTAPSFNTEVANELYIMGNNTPKSEYDDALDPVEFNLYDFIVDPNGNDLNPDNANRVQIGAQGGASSIVLSQRVREVTHDGEIVNENLVYVLPSATTFSISPRAGYYGYQEIAINMRDGSVDGDDTKYAQFTLMIYVTRNPGDVPVTDLRLAFNKLVEITPEKLFTDENDKNQGVGFVVKTIEKADSSSTIIDITSVDNTSTDVKNASELKASKKWFIRALNSNGQTPVRVEIAILGREDGDTVWKDFNIINVENQQPYLTSRYNVEGNVLFPSTELVNNTATIYANDFVNDYEQDVITLTSVKSKKSIVVDATIDSVNQTILLNFKGRGTSLITVKLKDESLVEYTYTFVAENIDLPQLNFFMRIGANVQSNPLIYTIILCGILLFLIILIIIIAAAKKKKRMREEIEALLVSEMELEEQMLKLAASPSPTFYQSYGYLSPTQNVQNNPQFMLGEGSNAPGPNPNALGLNAGTGNKAPNAGTPPTIDDDEL